MADIRTLTVDGTTYNIKDATARADITNLKSAITQKYLGQYAPSNFTLGKYVSSTNGNLNTLNGLNSSDYFTVFPGSNVDLISVNKGSTGTDTRGIAFYDANKQYISGVAYDSGSLSGEKQNISVPTNAMYARITVRNDCMDSYIITLDIGSTIYEKIEIMGNELSIQVTPILESGKFVSKTGTIGSNASFALSDYIECDNVKRIYTGYQGDYTVAFYDSAKAFLSSLQIVQPTWIAGWLNIDPPENAKYLRFNDYKTILPVEDVIIEYKSAVPVLKEMIDAQYDIQAFPSISLFDNIGVCGDSYTAAQFYNASGVIGDNPNISWGKILGRMCGIDVSIYASSGADTDNWQTRSTCLPALLSDTPRRLYVFALGINDYNTVTLGAISDIHEDYTENPNTYYGNFGKIIDQVMAHAPDAKIILAKCWLTESNYYNYSSAAIESIATHYNIPYIDTADSDFLNSAYYKNGKIGSHPTPPQQSGMAKAMRKLIENCIQSNSNYFNDYFPR